MGQSSRSSPPLAPGDSPPRAKLTSAHSAVGSRTRSKSQHHAVSFRGLPVTLASLGAGAWEAGQKEESDLKSHNSSLPPSENVAGSAAGGTRAAHPPLARTGSAARPAPQGAKRRIFLLADAVLPPLRHGRTHTALALKSPERTRRWRQSAGRGPRGPAAAPAPPPPPWPPPPREPIGPRRPQAAGRTATRLPGLCARTRKGWGRLESKHGSQVMLAAAGVGGTLRFSALPERVGLFHPGWR